MRPLHKGRLTLPGIGKELISRMGFTQLAAPEPRRRREHRQGDITPYVTARRVAEVSKYVVPLQREAGYFAKEKGVTHVMGECLHWIGIYSHAEENIGIAGVSRAKASGSTFLRHPV